MKEERVLNKSPSHANCWVVCKPLKLECSCPADRRLHIKGGYLSILGAHAKLIWLWDEHSSLTGVQGKNTTQKKRHPSEYFLFDILITLLARMDGQKSTKAVRAEARHKRRRHSANLCLARSVFSPTFVAA